MNLGKQLYELQQTDLDLEDKAEKLKQVESQLSNNEALTHAQLELEEKKGYLIELQKKQKTAEWKVDDIQAKLGPLEKKLYAGSVSNPKELVNLQEQVTKFKDQIRCEEDGILELMDQIEVQEKEIASKTADVGKLKKEWQKKQKELLAEQADLISAIDAVEKKRGEIASNMEPLHLDLYETLRARKQGRAVSRIEQGRCQGCQITLSVSELQQARVGGLVQCSSCSRILYLG